VTAAPPAAPGAGTAQVRSATRAVYLAFFGNGFLFASWAARIPQVRDGLRVSPGVLGLVLLCTAAGSVIATPLSGLVIARLGDTRTVAVMAPVAAAGMATVAVGYLHGIPPVAAGLFIFGFGSSTWDVAMNVQGTVVEHALGRAIMSRFHAGWSIGTVVGAGVGAAMVALGVPVTVHLLAAALVVAVTVPVTARRFLPHVHGIHHADDDRNARGVRDADGAARRDGTAARPDATAAQPDGTAARRSPLAAWTEPRTLLIGLFVLCMSFSEGTGNDWLSLAIIGGYHTAAALGTLTFAVFLAAMTAGRWFGPGFLDRYGRVRVLRVCAATAFTGLLVIEVGRVLPVALAGAVLLGLGTSLGFPVGLSAAGDDPRYAAGRVSTAASLGYAAFLAGPPSVGFLADHVGILHGLSIAGVLLAVAFFLCPVTAPLRGTRSPQLSGPEAAGFIGRNRLDPALRAPAARAGHAQAPSAAGQVAAVWHN
jgi:fucose permease